jgi:hypothetical protein
MRLNHQSKYDEIPRTAERLPGHPRDLSTRVVSVPDSQGKGKGALPFWDEGIANKKTARSLRVWSISYRRGVDQSHVMRSARICDSCNAAPR